MVAGGLEYHHIVTVIGDGYVLPDVLNNVATQCF